MLELLRILLELHATEEVFAMASYTSMTDQAMMEMLISGLSAKSKDHFQASNESYLDVCDWDFVECDTKDRVISIFFNGPTCFRGSVFLEYIPRCVIEFSVAYIPFEGTLDTTALPDRMHTLDIDTTHLSGTVNFTKFPERITTLRLESNHFTGSCDLTALPAALVTLSLSGNQFSGSLDLYTLPRTMGSLDISHNSFSGEFALCDHPDTLLCIDAQRNGFQGVAVAPKDGVEVRLFGNDITAVVDEKGCAHGKSDAFLRFTF